MRQRSRNLPNICDDTTAKTQFSYLIDSFSNYILSNYLLSMYVCGRKNSKMTMKPVSGVYTLCNPLCLRGLGGTNCGFGWNLWVPGIVTNLIRLHYMA